MGTATAAPPIKLYFLQASRSIRIAWLLEELNLSYESIFFPRLNKVAPADFKERSGNPLGKAPTLVDGGLTLGESGAITEYLIEKYDKEQRLMGGRDPSTREKGRAWIHAAEGTFMLHALAITYARWNAPPSVKESGALQEMEKGLAVNVAKDIDWLENELKANAAKSGSSRSRNAGDDDIFLVGEG